MFDDSESDNDNQLEKTPLLSRLQTSAVVFSDSDDDSDSSTSDDNHGDDRQEVGIVELTQASIEGGQGVLLDVPPPVATVTLVENNSAGEDALAGVGYVVGTSRLPIARVDVDFDTDETVREDPVGLGHLYKFFAPSMDQDAAVEALKVGVTPISDVIGSRCMNFPFCLVYAGLSSWILLAEGK